MIWIRYRRYAKKLKDEWINIGKDFQMLIHQKTIGHIMNYVN